MPNAVFVVTQVVSELEAIENEASYDYLKFEDEILNMNKDITQSDELLGSKSNDDLYLTPSIP